MTPGHKPVGLSFPYDIKFYNPVWKINLFQETDPHSSWLWQWGIYWKDAGKPCEIYLRKYMVIMVTGTSPASSSLGGYLTSPSCFSLQEYSILSVNSLPFWDSFSVPPDLCKFHSDVATCDPNSTQPCGSKANMAQLYVPCHSYFWGLIGSG